MAINLLPTEISPKGPVVRISNLLKNLATIFFAIFLIVGFGMGAYFILNVVTLRSVNTRSEALKTSIMTLEETEQGLVLVKDRLTKARTVLAEESAGEEVGALKAVGSALPTDVILSEAIASKDLLEVTFVATSSQGLSQIMAQIISQENFAKVELVSFSFNPNSGYIPSFAVTLK